MVIVMNGNATSDQIEAVNQRLIELGLKPNLIKGINRIVIGAVGERAPRNQRIRINARCRKNCSHYEAF